jgi:hypothetical protein
MDGWMHSLPPVSIPFTAASLTVLSTAFAASLTVSTGLLRTMGEVEKRRTWRVSAERNMIAEFVYPGNLVVYGEGWRIAIGGVVWTFEVEEGETNEQSEQFSEILKAGRGAVLLI